MRDAGVSIWEQIGTVEAARTALGDGIEVIIAQGWEAGGHNYGGLPTLALVPTVVDAVAPSLVLGAGGIADGRGAAAALALGADGVWVGSRMVATRESAVHPEHKRRIVAASGEQTVHSSIFGPEWPHFNPMRVVTIDDGGWARLFVGRQPVKRRPGRRQDMPPAWVMNGAIYLFKTECLFDPVEPNLYGDRVAAMVMRPPYGLNLDDPEDW